MTNKKVLAFDIGGTKIASAVVEISTGGAYSIPDYKKCETPASRTEIVGRIAGIADAYKSKHNFKTIGLAVAGQIDAAGDMVVCSPNIPALGGFSLREAVAQKTGFKTFMKNDVRCFALGEDRFGKYKNYKNAIFIAPGTGIGGAVKIGGKFYFGNDNIAGEFGHMVIEVGGKKCACGRCGCWERYFSGPAIEEMYAEAYDDKKAAKDIVSGALKGDEKDKKIMLEAGIYFAAGFSNLVNILNPEIAILGGSVFKGKGLLKFIMPFIQKEVLPSARKTKIVNSSLGDKAFLLGAAVE
jgi:predicted NBD/HSP70 family sugar kinase